MLDFSWMRKILCSYDFLQCHYLIEKYKFYWLPVMFCRNDVSGGRTLRNIFGGVVSLQVVCINFPLLWLSKPMIKIEDLILMSSKIAKHQFLAFHDLLFYSSRFSYILLILKFLVCVAKISDIKALVVLSFI